MKRFLVLLLVVLFSCQICFADDSQKEKEKNYSLRFNGKTYHLLYSAKSKDFGGYLNEYYQAGDTYNIWADMVAIHHFPNAYSPIDRIKDFKDYLSEMQIPSSLTFDDKKNSAMIDFVMISGNKLPVVLEFNIFKYEKSTKCGSLAVQYAKRYSATTAMEIEEIKKEFIKNRTKLIKKVKHYKIPEIITYDIDKCIAASNINKLETLQDDLQTELPPNTYIEDNTADLEIENKQTKIETNNIKENNVDTLISEELSENNNENTEKLVQNLQNDSTNNENLSENKAIIQKEQPTIIATTKQHNTTNKVKTDRKLKKSKKNTDNIKNINYVIANDKKDYIATPRTNKELRKEVKERKRAEKHNVNYMIINTNCELIATPRTKKELRQYRKELNKKRKLKERVKQAEKMLKE